MKFILFLFGLSLTACLIDVERSQKMVDFVNKLRTTWTAKLYERDISGLVGAWTENEDI